MPFILAVIFILNNQFFEDNHSLPNCACAEPPGEEWNRTYGNNFSMGYYVEELHDGYVVAATSFVGEYEDGYLIRVDGDGNIKWEKYFGGKDIDSIECVKKLNDEKLVAVGTTQSFGSGETDIWLIKLDENGKEIWNKTYGGKAIEIGRFVQQTKDGGFIIAGYTNKNGNDDAILIKTDKRGKEIWNRTYGGKRRDLAFCVQQTNDGGYIFIGWTNSFGNDADIWIVKTNAFGKEKWNITYGGKGMDIGRFVQQTKDGGYILIGSTSSIGNCGAILIKLNSDGREEWNKTYGGGEGYCVREAEDGYIWTGVSSDYDVRLVKTDKNGNVEWEREFGEKNVDEEGRCIQITSDGGCIIAGNTFPFHGERSHIWLIKFADVTPPSIRIEKPEKYIYIMDRKIIPFPIPLIIGKLSVEIYASDKKTGVDKIELYIDENLVKVFNEQPYKWVWNNSRGMHSIEAIAYDFIGNKMTDRISVMKI